MYVETCVSAEADFAFVSRVFHFRKFAVAADLFIFPANSLSSRAYIIILELLCYWCVSKVFCEARIFFFFFKGIYSENRKKSDERTKFSINLGKHLAL